jgi:hypothetical protein
MMGVRGKVAFIAALRARNSLTSLGARGRSLLGFRACEKVEYESISIDLLLHHPLRPEQLVPSDSDHPPNAPEPSAQSRLGT